MAIHRDDVPFDVAEEAVKKLQEMYPGFKVVFSGDAPADMPEEDRKKLEDVELRFAKRQAEHLVHGFCFDCGAEHPRPWPPEDDGALAEGWSLYSDVSSKKGILICPACDQEEGAQEIT